MRSDCHIHVRGDERPAKVLRAMDAARLDVIGAISLPPESFVEQFAGQTGHASDRERMEGAARLIAGNPERIRAFYWLDPTAPDAIVQVERAVADFAFSGVKLIPNHWHPFEERFLPVYEKIQSLGVPILFHTGILWGNADSSRFCMPAALEVLQNFPRLRWLMAHVAWPWTDECIAVADRFKTMARLADGRDPELRRDYAARNVNLHDRRFEVDVACKVDLTPGTPPVYRAEVLTACYEALGSDMLVFGTDASGADDLSSVRSHQERDERIFLDELGLAESDIERILGTNFLRMFEPMKKPTGS